MTLQPDHIAVRPCQSGQSNYSVQSDQQLQLWVEAPIDFLVAQLDFNIQRTRHGDVLDSKYVC